MKNKILIFLLLFFINVGTNTFSENFIFETSEINVLDNGNILNAKNGTATSVVNNIFIEAEEFSYNKLTLILDATIGVAKSLDKDIEIKADNFSFDQNLSELTAIGNVLIIDNKNNLLIKSEKILFNSKNNNLESKTFSTIEDSNGNFFSTNHLFYSSEDRLLKLNDAQLIDNKKNIYQITDTYLDLNTQHLLGKDLNAKFTKRSYDTENEPRLKGLSFSSKEDISIISKGIFTTCKDDDSCPPWQISAEKITHNKKKKTLYYDNAWLKLYDIPVFYFPKFFHPDPTVKRQSGFLMPSFISSTNLGSSFTLPYYQVISDNKDFTINPRFYENNQALLQSEYRQVNDKSQYILDFSNTFNNDNSNYGHLYSSYEKKIGFLSFETTDLTFNIEQSSKNAYLKAYNIKSPLIKNTNILTSNFEIDSYSEGLSFNTNFKVTEDLSKKNSSDRYEFIYPSYTLSKQLDNLNFFQGDYLLNSSGYVKNYNTNIFEKIIINDLKYTSDSIITKNGYNNKFNILLKNINTKSQNSLKYKDKMNYEIASIFQYDLSYPLIRKNKNSYNILKPLTSIRFSPNNNKDRRNESKKIDMNNIFSLNRLGSQDTVEGGTSVTYGIEYSNNDTKSGKQFFKGSIANIARLSEDDNLSNESKLGKKNSDIVGNLTYSPNQFLKLNYDFSQDNNFTDTNYQLLGTEIKINNFVTTFEYLNDNNSPAKNSFYTNKTSINIGNSKDVIFKTRRNQKTNITEFYNLIYQYRDDCLIAAIEYNRDYYKDGSLLKPEENIFFKLTIVPFGETSSSNLMR